MLCLVRLADWKGFQRWSAVSVLCLVRLADWKGLQRLFSWRYIRSLCKTTFSTILDRNGRFETGR